MRNFEESKILDPGFRKKVIEEMINGQENTGRKLEMLRRHEIYRDKNSKWVMEALAAEGYKKETLAQMRNRVANISVARKIINKLAQTYSGGVDRTPEVESDQETIDKLVELLCVDQAMKKTDRYRQLFKNAAIQVVPVKSGDVRPEDGKPLYKLAVKIYAPWEYDVIEYSDDPTKPCVYILTDFRERFRVRSTAGGDAYQLGADGHRVPLAFPDGSDRRDEVIADDPADDGNDDKREFIWWSPSFHFTTDAKGQIVNPTPAADDTQQSGTANPIKRLPFVNVAADQDGHFWAQGGEDVVEGSILINKKLTDINYISFVQGWGQLVIAAKEIPKLIEGGPDNALCFNVNPGDPNPAVFFAKSDPPIGDWLETVRATVALLLTTNDLDSNTVSANLDVKNAASGVSMLIQSAEYIGDIKDVQKVFQDAEPEFWDIVQKWHVLYGDTKSLKPELQELKPIASGKMSLKFHEVKPPISEADKLNNLLLRKNIGIDTTLDLIKKDNPDLTDEEAKLKLAEVTAENKKKQADALAAASALGNTPGANGNGKKETGTQDGAKGQGNENQKGVPGQVGNT